MLEIYVDQLKHPLLTFIIVTKRHLARFFTYNPNPNHSNKYGTKSRKPLREIDNMSAGAAIDTKIVCSYEDIFYLNPHNTP